MKHFIQKKFLILAALIVTLGLGLGSVTAYGAGESLTPDEPAAESPVPTVQSDSSGTAADDETPGALPEETASGTDPESEVSVTQGTEEQTIRYEAMDAVQEFNIGAATFPSSGTASVLCLYISFPDCAFADGDTPEAFQNLITGAEDPSSANYPYESLNAYYHRASYGKLAVTGQVYTYTAQHELSYYDQGTGGNLAALAIEALAALDQDIDYSQFDGDGDGVIDAIYLHYPCGDSATWDSTFWSKAFRLTSDTTFDGKAVGGCVTLHRASNTLIGAQTIIHETGHALGLPDLYYYTNRGSQGAASWRTGTCTWDMMENNGGDIDAYCKWMLGWISYDDITRVVANRDGVKVYKGSTLISSSAADTSASLTLSAFDWEDASVTGGFIIVSNTDAASEDEAKYSDFFLITLEQAAGNQRLTCWAGTDLLPTGFRVYKIQGKRTENGCYIHSNCNVGFAEEHNVLIECMDFDYYGTNDHTQSQYSVVPYKRTSSGGTYGCYLPVDFLFNYNSSPCTTNFQENTASGFTGIWMKNTGVDAAAGTGTITIGYSPEGGTSDTDKVTFTYANPTGMIDHSALTFTSDRSVARATYNLYPRITVDGTDYTSYSYTVKDSHTVIVYTDALGMNGRLKASSQIKVTFLAGMFQIGSDASGNPIVNSEEIEVTVPTGPLASVTDTRTVSGLNIVANPTVSNTVTIGSSAYLVCRAQDLQLEVMDREHPENCSLLTVTGVSALSGTSLTDILLYPCGQDMVIALLHYQDKSNQLIWIRTDTGAAVAEKLINNKSLDVIKENVFTAGDGKIYYKVYSNTDSKMHITCYYPGDTGLTEETTVLDTTGTIGNRLAFSAVYSSYSDSAAGGPTLLFVFSAYDGISTCSYSVVPVSGSSFYQYFQSSLSSGLSVSALCAAADTSYSFSNDVGCYPWNFTLTEDGKLLALLSQTATGSDGTSQVTYLLDQFDTSGTRLSRTKIVSALNMDQLTPHNLLCGPNGQIAIIGYNSTSSASAHHEVILLSQDDLASSASTTDCGQYICVDNNAVGYWADSQYFAAFADWATTDSPSVVYYQADLIKVGKEQKKDPVLLTPTASDFTFTAPADLTAGTARSASVAVRSGVTGMGTVTVYYSTDGKTWTTAAPSAAGTYQVAVQTAAGTGYKASSDYITDSSWTFTLTKIKEGTVQIPDAKQAGNYASGRLSSSADDVGKIVLTADDRTAIAAGRDVSVWAAVYDYSSGISAAEKNAIAQKLPRTYTIGLYLDISLWKQVSGSDAVKITELSGGKVKISFMIPEALRQTGRTWTIIRLHDGTAEVLDVSVDSDYELTFETDRFSAYALAYKNASTTVTPKTGDSSNIGLWLSLMAASGATLAGLTVYRIKRRKSGQP